MHNTTSLLVGVAVLAVVGILVYVQSTKAPDLAAPQNTPAQTQETAQPAQGSSYTAADVAKHASAADCWTIINGSVYDLTQWVSRHPGGERAITKLCGTDGSEEFNEQHAGGAQQASVLAGFRLGALAQ